MLSVNFPFTPGDLVRFKAYEHEYGASEITITRQNRKTIINSGSTRMEPPVMVVMESVISNTQPNATGENQVQSVSKVLCQWFSYERCEFQDRWFDTRLLVKNLEQNNSEVLEKTDFIYGLCVTMKTALLSNRQTKEEMETSISQGSKTEDGTNYIIARTFDTLNYQPPKMLATGVCDRSPMPSVFDKKKGGIYRKISSWTVKCMWYDFKTGKYSEHNFAPETLIKCGDLPSWELDAWGNSNIKEILKA